jgi:hypothetical protein
MVSLMKSRIAGSRPTARGVLREILRARSAAGHALDTRRIVGAERKRLQAIIGPGPGGDVEGLDEATVRGIVFQTRDEIRARVAAPRTNEPRMNWGGRAQEAVVSCALWTLSSAWPEECP